MNLDELVEEIRKGPSSLFYGAGVTITCGGPCWEDLFSAIRTRFPGGTASSFFEYMQEVIGFDNSNRAEAEDLIRTLIASISPQDDQEYLFSIPWRAVLTTNYDHLPDSIGTTIDGRRQIIPIVDPTEQIDQTREEHLYCFKLLGDCGHDYPKGGWMVLSTSDLFSEAERRNVFFKQFRNLAISGHIVYLGYSFKDDLVFLLLSQMKNVLGHFPWRGFSVTPSEPEPDIMKKMESLGITWVKGTLEDFVSAAKRAFGEKPKSAPVEPGIITVHGQTIELDLSILSNISNKFNLLHNELLRYSGENPTDFLRGICSSFFPYVYNWDFRRKTEVLWSNPKTRASIPRNLGSLKERVKIEDLSENIFATLVGIAGSGKTVVANRIAFDWYQTGNPVIFIDAESLFVDTDALDGLMNEIREKYLEKARKAGVKSPLPLRWLIIGDGCGPLISELKILRNHLMSTAKPADLLLVTRETETPIDRLKNCEVDVIYRVEDTVLPEEREEFARHFKRFGVVDEDILNRNLQNKEINSSFFALIFSSIRHSQETIKRLLEREYNSLDAECRNIYRTACLIQSYQLSPLLSLVMKCEAINPDWLDFQVKRGSLGGVLRFSDYGSSLMPPNRIVAEVISSIGFRSSEDVKSSLSRIISAVTFGDLTEMMFLDNLLNHRVELDIGPRLLINQKIDLFRQAVRVVKSRPLLIHLGRLETNVKRFSDARKTLREAHYAQVRGFEERLEHVLDAEGRLELAIAENEIDLGNDDLAWEHLDIAEEKFNAAKIDPSTTPHPYEGLGRTYLEKARLVKDESIQWVYVLAAMQECNYVEKYLGEKSEIFEISLLKLEIENTLSRIGLDETHIDKIGSRVGKANGYAYLAEHKKARGQLKEALELVDKGLESDGMNIWLMRLRIELLRRLSPDDHTAIMKTLEDYYTIMTERYDIELSFELAKETYVMGHVIEAKRMFRTLFRKAKNHPRRLIPREPEDRWIEKGKPARLIGTITKIPTEDRYGEVRTTFPTTFRDSIVVRERDLQFENPRAGDRVSYEVVFNMLGPEASRVRKR